MGSKIRSSYSLTTNFTRRCVKIETELGKSNGLKLLLANDSHIKRYLKLYMAVLSLYSERVLLQMTSSSSWKSYFDTPSFIFPDSLIASRTKAKSVSSRPKSHCYSSSKRIIYISVFYPPPVAPYIIFFLSKNALDITKYAP